MIIQLNNQKFRIKFWKAPRLVDYADLQVSVGKDAKQIILNVKERVVQVFHTTCVIEQLCVGETERWTAIGQGLAKQDPRDVYSKRIGKKYALKRAMEFAKFDRFDRAGIWGLFVKTFGGWR